MRCFIHNDKEAIGVCKKCGKAMCNDCSSFNNHNGICPACMRKNIVNIIKEYNKKIAYAVFIFILATTISGLIRFEAAIFFGIICAIFIAVPVIKSKPYRRQLEVIDTAYSKGTKEI